MYRSSSPPTVGQEGGTNPKTSMNIGHFSQPLQLRVLPTMAMKVFRLRLIKLLKLPPNQANGVHKVHAWMLMDDDSLSEMDFEPGTQEVSWWGLEEGSRILVYAGDAF